MCLARHEREQFQGQISFAFLLLTDISYGIFAICMQSERKDSTRAKEDFDAGELSFSRVVRHRSLDPISWNTFNKSFPHVDDASPG